MDDLDELTISTKCAYCGEALSFEDERADQAIEIVVEWDHVCTTPPPIILTLLPDEDED